jgi:hypothetical protein
MGKYSGKKLPELYFIAVQKGLKDFFGKKEEEMEKILEEDDVNPIVKDTKKVDDNNSSKTFETSPKKEKIVAKKVIPEEDIIDVDEDETPVKVIKRADEAADDPVADAEEDEEEMPAKVSLKKMDRSELKSFIKEQELDVKVFKSDEDDDIRAKIKEALAGNSDEDTETEEDEKPAKKGNTVAKKVEVEEKPVKKAVKVEVKKDGKAFEKVDRNPETATNPYREGTAGACAFTALTKGGTMEQVVERCDALIAKGQIKPPSNTAAKIKIIITEINAAKHGNWGKFETSDKGKITYTK